MEKENKIMIELPDERPFALYDNRFFLSAANSTGGYDLIIKGDCNVLAAALVHVMLGHEAVADILIAAVDEYKKRK